jgi:hypothetical protein
MVVSLFDLEVLVMLRRVLATLGIAVFIAVFAWLALYLVRKPVTQDEALAFATQRLQRSGQQLRFDPSLFTGPTPIAIGGATYGFRWNYSDSSGSVRIIISVDQDGGTEFAFDGDLDRLRTYQK